MSRHTRDGGRWQGYIELRREEEREEGGGRREEGGGRREEGGGRREEGGETWRGAIPFQHTKQGSSDATTLQMNTKPNNIS